MKAQSLQRLTEPIARLRYVVLPLGLICVAALTVPNLVYAKLRWAEAVLWFCLFFYVVEWVQQLLLWRLAPPPRPKLEWTSQTANALAVFLVPIAHLLGVPPATAWLFAAVWLLKVPAATSGFSLLYRAFILEAKPLTSVIVVFFIILFTSAVAMHLVERDIQPNAFG